MLNIELRHDPVVPFLDMYPKEMKTGVQTKNCTWMFIIVLFTNSQEVETSQMSISWCMLRQSVVYPYNGIFGRKKAWNTGAYHNTDEHWKYAKGKKPDTDGHVWYDSIRVDKSIEIKQISGWEGGLGNDCLMGIWLWVHGSFSGGENVLELDVVMVAQHREYIKFHWIVYFKMVKMVMWILQLKILALTV